MQPCLSDQAFGTLCREAARSRFTVFTSNSEEVFLLVLTTYQDFPFPRLSPPFSFEDPVSQPFGV